MKNLILTLIGLGCGILTYAQTDITTGGSYATYLQNRTSSGNGMLLHNAMYNSSTGTYQWVTGPHSTFGSRGIEFQYYAGISFYADDAATTAGGNFMPTTRMFIGNGGNVGIGTSTPAQKLDVVGNVRIDGPVSTTNHSDLEFYRGDGTKFASIGQGNLGVANSTFDIQHYNGNDIRFLNSGTEQVRFLASNGNVGIGTASPNQKLEVNGGILQNSENTALGIDAQTNARLGFVKKFGFGPVIASDATSAIVFAQSNQTGIHTNISGATLTERMRIGMNGYVGIGTANPDYPLTVNGSVHAKEVRVDLNVPAPDYVFQKDYQLTPLDEIKNYIDQNKHLPEVPSAKEMEKNGVQLGEMNMILLKKIEELTLHMIEQNKKLDATLSKIESQQKEITEMKSRIK
ncbi:MAG TPA: hypothetical protein VL728_12750 [Cyclobacteriaceae bacterium]|nr:hypothetical protein [Cyclobacteriaceae bacterium]